MREFDKILLYGLRFYGYHGVYAEEKKLGQWFEVDLDIWGDFSDAAASDNLRDALNYEQVYTLVRDIMEGPPANLLESVARRIMEKILLLTPVRKVQVRIKKPQAPVKGMISFAGVETTGCKDEG